MYRQLIDYLPDVIQSVEEYRAIMAAEQPEIEVGWDLANEALDNQFISDLTLYGVLRWEKILSIVPEVGSTLEARKREILAKLLSELPYTWRKLEEIMNNMVGKANYELNLRNEAYTLTIRLSEDGYAHLNAVKNMLDVVLPANLVYAFTAYARYKIKSCAYVLTQCSEKLRISPFKGVS